MVCIKSLAFEWVFQCVFVPMFSHGVREVFPRVCMVLWLCVRLILDSFLAMGALFILYGFTTKMLAAWKCFHLPGLSKTNSLFGVPDR